MKEDPTSLGDFTRMDISSFCDLLDNVPPLNSNDNTPMLHAMSQGERLAVTLRYVAADMYPGHFAASVCFCSLATELFQKVVLNVIKLKQFTFPVKYRRLRLPPSLCLVM